ncbi:MAG: non-ribosomal peptide synthetase, partial [bacterium]|nr:non-ribosomal peptide synthetase [bacterium]
LARVWADILEMEEEKIGTAADFFELGGHSLKATILISRIHKTFHVKIPFAIVFRFSTIREMAKYIEEQAGGGGAGPGELAGAPVPGMEATSQSTPTVRDYYLTVEGNPGSTAYNRPIVMLIEGRTEIEKIQQAFIKLIHRHEILRTTFYRKEITPLPAYPGHKQEKPVITPQVWQRVHGEFTFALERYEAAENETGGIIEEFVRPFSLQQAPLLRVGIIKINPQKYQLMIDIHRIISDASTMGIMINDLTAFYRQEELPALPFQYNDYSRWVNRRMKNQKIRQQEMYWLKRFKDNVPLLNLPYDYPRPAERSLNGDRVGRNIEKETAVALKKLATETETTLFMVLLAVYTILLAKYGRQELLTVGVPISGRRQEDMQTLMGLFVNLLPMKNAPEEQKQFPQFLDEVKGNALKAYENQDYPFEELVERLEVTSEPGRRPMFDIVFSMENMEFPIIEFSQLKFTPQPAKKENVNFDLFLLARESEDEIVLEFSYVTALFKEGTVKKLLDDYVDILKQVIEKPNKSIRDIIIHR